MLLSRRKFGQKSGVLSKLRFCIALAGTQSHRKNPLIFLRHMILRIHREKNQEGIEQMKNTNNIPAKKPDTQPLEHSARKQRQKKITPGGVRAWPSTSVKVGYVAQPERRFWDHWSRTYTFNIF
jgi:hypothetical protein